MPHDGLRHIEAVRVLVEDRQRLLGFAFGQQARGVFRSGDGLASGLQRLEPTSRPGPVTLHSRGCDGSLQRIQEICAELGRLAKASNSGNAATLAMHGDGTHKVTLDQVIETMRQTGLDMSSSYKETSKGGLAVNVPEC